MTSNVSNALLTAASADPSAQIVTIDPATGAELARYDAMAPGDVERTLAAVHGAAGQWAATSVAERAALLRSLAAVLRSDADRLAALATAEMGKPLAEARGEVLKSATTAEYYAEAGPALLANAPVDLDTPEVEAWVAQEPIGVVLAVMPWNFPIWQVMRAAIPIVMAGNGLLLKHSPNVTGSALAMREAFVAAGFPADLVGVLVVAEPDVPQTIDGLIADPSVAAVTLTGSNRAGAAVGAAAGRAAKPSVLELGGSDPFVVLADADVAAAAAAGVKARFHNAGQSCVCAKRFVVHADVAQEFTRRFIEGARALVLGDPTDAATQIGPLARADLREVLQRQVDESVAAGAELAAGGRPVDGPGCFYEPTVLTGTGPGMAVFDEETFGPVAAIAVARDDDHAVELANATEFGLGLSVWSASTDHALAVARRITSGAAFVNAIVASDPRLPFGGTKRSGYGRELAAPGLLAFSNSRTFWVAR